MLTDLSNNTELPLGLRCNNPGNIRPGYDWEGMKGVHDAGKNGQFIIFADVEYGIRALALDIYNKWVKGRRTIRKIIERYAPPSENKTEEYIMAVSKDVDMEPEQYITMNLHNLQSLVKAIIRHENGNEAAKNITPSIIATGCSLLPARILEVLK